jgi:hypothetical protein
VQPRVRTRKPNRPRLPVLSSDDEAPCELPAANLLPSTLPAKKGCNIPSQSTSEQDLQLYWARGATGPVSGSGGTCYGCDASLSWRKEHTRKGDVHVRGHYMHVGARKETCSLETVAHRAAKDGAANLPLDIWMKCHLCDSEWDLMIHDKVASAIQEHPWSTYRLDVGLLDSSGSTIGGIEILQKHSIGEKKAADLTAGGLVWAEIKASDVLAVIEHGPRRVHAVQSASNICIRCRQSAYQTELEKHAEIIRKEESNKQQAQLLVNYKAQEAFCMFWAKYNDRVITHGKMGATCFGCSGPLDFAKPPDAHRGYFVHVQRTPQCSFQTAIQNAAAHALIAARPAFQHKCGLCTAKIHIKLPPGKLCANVTLYGHVFALGVLDKDAVVGVVQIRDSQPLSPATLTSLAENQIQWVEVHAFTALNDVSKDTSVRVIGSHRLCCTTCAQTRWIAHSRSLAASAREKTEGDSAIYMAHLCPTPEYRAAVDQLYQALSARGLVDKINATEGAVLGAVLSSLTRLKHGTMQSLSQTDADAAVALMQHGLRGVGWGKYAIRSLEEIATSDPWYFVAILCGLKETTDLKCSPPPDLRTEALAHRAKLLMCIDCLQPGGVDAEWKTRCPTCYAISMKSQARARRLAEPE